MRLQRFSLGLLCLCLPLAAWADAIDVQLHPRGMAGKNFPGLEIRIMEPIAGFHVQLKRSDGKMVDVKGGGKPGQVRNIDLVQPEGTFQYTGEITVNFPNAAVSSMALDFKAEYLSPLKISFDKKDLDLEQRKLTFSISRPAKKAVLKIITDTGQTVEQETPFNGEPAGTPLTINWPETKGNVMDINVQAWDTNDFFNGLELSPFRVSIPHEEVNFDTGKWDIRSGEEPKLNDSYDKIANAVRQYAAVWPKKNIRLFIAGHTDTVGDRASNRELSVNRARAIGQYFRKKGARIPILYEGFGEEALKVGTPDETDEEKNRRVEYILAIEDPTVKNVPFPPKWKRL